MSFTHITGLSKCNFCTAVHVEKTYTDSAPRGPYVIYELLVKFWGNQSLPWNG